MVPPREEVQELKHKPRNNLSAGEGKEKEPSVISCISSRGQRE